LKAESLQLIRGTDEHIAFVMATERLPGYEQLVGRWSEAKHRAALADSRYAYFIGRLGAQDIGFAIVRDWASAERAAHIKRIAVCHPGLGHGKLLLASLVDLIFRGTDAYRISLGVFPQNERARRAYAAVGFRDEGIARGSAFFGGVHHDEMMMALLRPEWPVGRNLKASQGSP